jgi:hypothetical protein
MKIKYILTILSSLLHLMKSDIPVHCLKSQIIGDWQFEISQFKWYEKTSDNRCGHDSN